MKFTYTVHQSAQRNCNFKMLSYTTLLSSVEWGFLNLRVNITFLLMHFHTPKETCTRNMYQKLAQNITQLYLVQVSV